jgi:UDP-galactopyranose mutase
MFENMLDHPNIKILLNCDWREIEHEVRGAQIVFTGPVDEYFDHCFGPLPYRSLRFRHLTLNQPQLQPVAVVNYPDESVPYTRVTEYKHLTGQVHPQTSVTFEYPAADGDPFYPIPQDENAALYRRYQRLADSEPGVHFVGRLATYRYYNMDQVVAQALALYARIAGRKRQAGIVRAPSRAAAVASRL